MKRTTYIYIFILLILGGLAMYMLSQNRSGTVPQALKDFAVKDTENITKIFMADRNGNSVLLERKSPSEWQVNKKYKVNKDKIDMLLETMRLVEMKNPVPVRAKKNYLKEMLLGATKVEIYKGADLKPAKVYTVGGTTPDMLGTIMLLQGSTDPFVTWIPGFNGFLTTRYFVGEKDWRSREIYALSPEAIRQVEYTYNFHPESSFIFTSDGKQQFEIAHLVSPTKTSEVKAGIAKSFLVGFNYTEFEAYYKGKPAQFDSILATKPLLTIKVNAEGKDLPTLNLYPIIATGSAAMYGRNPYDESRFLGSLSSSPKEIFIAQQMALAKILKEYKDLAR